MNIALIFAGGAGTRMNSKAKPKQFLEVNGKPIIIHTLEIFEQSNEIDLIVVACIENSIDFMHQLVKKYGLHKVQSIIPGGETGQLSIYNGLCEAKRISGNEFEKSICLIHDGVRPLINEQVIHDNIESVKKFGSAITCTVAKETIVLIDETGYVQTATDREVTRIAKAPQSFYLKDVYEIEKKAIESGKINIIDTCTLMQQYGKKIHIVEGPFENIKVTTPDDFYTLRALLQAKENSQIYGL